MRTYNMYLILATKYITYNQQGLNVHNILLLYIFLLLSGSVYDHLHGCCDVDAVLPRHHTDAGRKDGMAHAENYGDHSYWVTWGGIKYLLEWSMCTFYSYINVSRIYVHCIYPPCFFGPFYSFTLNEFKAIILKQF